jgi:hypothetical protein
MNGNYFLKTFSPGFTSRKLLLARVGEVWVMWWASAARRSALRASESSDGGTIRK